MCRVCVCVYNMKVQIVNPVLFVVGGHIMRTNSSLIGEVYLPTNTRSYVYKIVINTNRYIPMVQIMHTSIRCIYDHIVTMVTNVCCYPTFRNKLSWLAASTDPSPSPSTYPLQSYREPSLSRKPFHNSGNLTQS